MKLFRVVAIAAVAASAFAQAHSASSSDSSPTRSDRAKLIGAWHLISITGPDGNAVSTLPVGMLVYTPDGHMSVQLMYPKSESALSNQYVRSGYEASFGRYDVDETKHMVTHHVEGSVTRDLLVGKDLPRLYLLTNDGRLVIKSAHSDEHWSVTWEHY